MDENFQIDAISKKEGISSFKIFPFIPLGFVISLPVLFLHRFGLDEGGPPAAENILH